MLPSYRSVDRPTPPLSRVENRLVLRAIAILEKRFFRRGAKLENSQITKRYLQLKLASCKHEAFAVLFLDTKHRVITFEVLAEGSICHAAIPIRRVLQRALETNSAAVILAHNHPSGDVSPSDEDQRLTRKLKDWLLEVEVRVVDHIIVGSGSAYSFVEAGCL